MIFVNKSGGKVDAPFHVSRCRALPALSCLATAWHAMPSDDMPTSLFRNHVVHVDIIPPDIVCYCIVLYCIVLYHIVLYGISY